MLTLIGWSEPHVHNHENDTQDLCGMLNNRRSKGIHFPQFRWIEEMLMLWKLDRQPGVIRQLPIKEVRKMDITFKCCKHLDHTKGRYGDCKLKDCHGIFVYWERGETWTEGGRNPRDVQFCSRRGRLNFKSACIASRGGECSDYDEEERTVEVKEG